MIDRNVITNAAAEAWSAYLGRKVSPTDITILINLLHKQPKEDE